VIQSAAVFQAERRACLSEVEVISHNGDAGSGRSLARLVKTRGFGMTPQKKVAKFKLTHYPSLIGCRALDRR